MKRLPHKAMEYIRNNFREAYMKDFQTLPDKKKGGVFYRVNVYEDNTIHHLEFNLNGDLKRHGLEAAYKGDMTDGDFFEEDLYRNWIKE